MPGETLLYIILILLLLLTVAVAVILINLFGRRAQSGKAEGELDRKLTGVRQELEQKIPLARKGGYIMHSDHSCPPDVTLEQYSWMLKRARAIFYD